MEVIEPPMNEKHSCCPDCIIPPVVIFCCHFLYGMAIVRCEQKSRCKQSNPIPIRSVSFISSHGPLFITSQGSLQTIQSERRGMMCSHPVTMHDESLLCMRFVWIHTCNHFFLNLASPPCVQLTTRVRAVCKPVKTLSGLGKKPPRVVVCGQSACKKAARLAHLQGHIQVRSS